MPITTRPVPARTDGTVGDPPTGTRAVRATGVAVALGSLIWSVGLFAVGGQPTDSLQIAIGDLTGGVFQLGLFALVATQLRTRATGVSRIARGMLKVEFGLLTVATLWSVLHAVPALRDAGWLAVMDLFWPLSMLGMFIIGVKIAFAGRWRGPARAWPLVAESWAVVVIPCLGLFGQGAVDVVGPAHLLIGYVGLGVLLAARPELTGATRE